MPTVTLTHSDTRELQEIADTICRANSILVVTGAGISTNSGIPVRKIKKHFDGLSHA